MTKLRWRRRFRRSKRQVEDISVQTEQHVERHFFRRLNRFWPVRRFVFGWLSFMTILVVGLAMNTQGLGEYYLELKAAPGGTYTEGILGSFTNANPMYAKGGVNGAVSKLVFSGLLTHDQNNELIGDLASSWAANERGDRYELKLRQDVFWHDGTPFTSADVLFTYAAIQNPDAKSPLQSSWTGIKIAAPDDYTVTFVLPNVLSAFPHSLTNGIVPKHLLQDVPVAQLRSVDFNTVYLVGTGPFKLDIVQVIGADLATRQEKIGLVANADYYLGQPKLDRFVVHAFRDEDVMFDRFSQQQLNAFSGATTIPDTLNDVPNLQIYNMTLTGEIIVFLRNSHDILSDQNVRQALVKATDVDAIVQGLGYPAIAARSPFLQSHVGYDSTVVQFATNVEEAKAQLTEAGWIEGADGLRSKGKTKLKFTLHAQNNSEYAYVTGKIQQQWRDVGVDLEVILPEDADFQTTATFHNYDALLYGISLGGDPDVFAYWHSSQGDILATNRFNFSEYKSDAADEALEAGRTRTDPKLRAIKYKPFLTAWSADAPAVVLYQPRFLYVSRGSFEGLQERMINTATDRFNTVHNWTIREVKTLKE